MSEHEIRFGLMGYGLWGRHHAAAIARTDGAHLTAVAARDAESLAAAEKNHPQVARYDDYRQMLESEALDAVDVALPNHLHFEAAKAALEAGKHVFIEKPMTVRIEQADELLALAKQRGLLLAVDHEMRLSMLWGRVKQLIDQGTVGTPQYVLLELSRFPYRFGSEGWRYDIVRVGNWILEEPIHFFDLARWYLDGAGEPETVYALANSRQEDHPELQDNFSTLVRFPAGAYAVITQTLSAFEHHQTVKVSGTRGAIWARWSGPDARTDTPSFSMKYSVGDESHEIDFKAVTGEIVELRQQVEAVVEAIRSGRPPVASGEDGRWAVLMCLAAQHSVDTGQIVALEEFAASAANKNE